MADPMEIKDTTANPAPLGLMGFGMTLVVVYRLRVQQPHVPLASAHAARCRPATSPGRQFLFEITGTKLGDCSGRDVPIHVHGCLIRTDGYFPMPQRKDAGGQ